MTQPNVREILSRLVGDEGDAKHLMTGCRKCLFCSEVQPKIDLAISELIKLIEGRKKEYEGIIKGGYSPFDKLNGILNI